MMKTTVMAGVLMVLLCGCSGDMTNPGNAGRVAAGDDSVKVLVIGFDGGTWDMFKPAVELGKMPRLQQLMKQSVHSELETIIPTLTPVIWTTIATGRLPEDHGVKAVVEIDPVTREMKPLTSQSSRVKPVWHILSEEKKQVSIVRWPLTWPVEAVNGEIVSDYAFQTTRLHRTWPSVLTEKVDTFTEKFTLRDIVDLTGVNRGNYQKLEPFWQWKLMVLLREFQLDVQFKNVAQSLFKQNQRDFSAVYFYSLDALGHNFYQFLKPSPDRSSPDFSGLIMNWCGLYDGFLSDILDAVDPETYIIICSDHGMNLTLEPQKFLVLSEDTPPEKLGEPQEIALPPGPPFDADPFSVTLHYTAPSGEHSRKPDGIFLMAGPGVIKDRKVSKVHITDILPTILYVMDLPISDEFAGTPRLDLFQPDFTSGRPVKRIESYETDERVSTDIPVEDYNDEDDLLLNRLQALGYIN
jgi:predicted AlkP superfamily phosphohydrolase/phosphomutase